MTMRELRWMSRTTTRCSDRQNRHKRTKRIGASEERTSCQNDARYALARAVKK